MTRPKDGSHIPDSDRWPGLRRHTPIPPSLSGQLRPEQMEVIQSYKGHAVLMCKVCGGCPVLPVREDADWSCPFCAAEKFEAACGQVTKIGTRHERPHTRPDRTGHGPADGPEQRPLAA